MRIAINLLVVCGLLASIPASAAADPEATSVPGLSGAGEAILRGPDDAMWIAEPDDPGAIARVTAAGAVTEYRGGVTPNLRADREPNGLAVVDGVLWFISDDGDELGRITTAGTVTRHQLDDGRATAVAAGPDGRLWMTVENDPGEADLIARMDTVNSATTFHLAAGTNPRSITAGPDGALWFVETGGSGRIGRITTTGQLSWQNVGGVPSTIAAGPLGSMWYARGAGVFRFGEATTFSTGSATYALATGPDGALWAALTGGVARIDPGGTTTVHQAGVPSGARGRGIAAGPDGRMWMTLDRTPYLVRVTVPPRVADVQALADASSVTAAITPNGLDTEVHAEVQQADGTWQSAGSVNAGAGTGAFPVTLALRGLAAGRTHVVRLRAINAAGSAVSADVKLVLPQTPEPPENAPPDPPTTVTPPEVTVTPVPVQGKTVVLTAGTGTVRIKAPGQNGYTTLEDASNVPVGSLIDTTTGSVVLASRVGGKTQSGTFHGGKFRIEQARTGMTALKLAGELSCGSRLARASAAAKPKPKRRRVWGQDSGGRFQTHGKSSVATVRGTRWLTEDTCTGTRVRVSQGAVSVKPSGKRAVLVRAGHSLFTRHQR